GWLYVTSPNGPGIGLDAGFGAGTIGWATRSKRLAEAGPQVPPNRHYHIYVNIISVIRPSRSGTLRRGRGAPVLGARSIMLARGEVRPGRQPVARRVRI